MKYIDADLLRKEIERERKNIEGLFIEGDNNFYDGQDDAYNHILALIDSLQQKQPDTEEQSSHLEYWLAFFGCPEENIEKCATQIAQGYGAIRYLEGIQLGAEAVNELAQQEQPMPDSTKLIELWHEDKEMLKEKDFRNDPWRLAYNAFLCGFGRGIAVNKQEQPEVDLEEAAEHYAIPFNDTTYGVEYSFKGFKAGAEWQKEQMEASTPVLGEVHHVLNCHYIETDSKQLGARLRGFPDGAKVDIYIIARKKDKK